MNMYASLLRQIAFEQNGGSGKAVTEVYLCTIEVVISLHLFLSMQQSLLTRLDVLTVNLKLCTSVRIQVRYVSKFI